MEATEVKTTLDQLEITIKQLSLKSGDLLVIKTPELDGNRLNFLHDAFARVVHNLKQIGIQIECVIMPDNFDASVLKCDCQTRPLAVTAKN